MYTYTKFARYIYSPPAYMCAYVYIYICRCTYKSICTQTSRRMMICLLYTCVYIYKSPYTDSPPTYVYVYIYIYFYVNR